MYFLIIRIGIIYVVSSDKSSFFGGEEFPVLAYTAHKLLLAQYVWHRRGKEIISLHVTAKTLKSTL